MHDAIEEAKRLLPQVHHLAVRASALDEPVEQGRR
jgi:hypothetical protein